mmetsp:Transcript_75185/g.200693  ORF Transcript_75185/g.200693 Transcript_75185/m.200693 type:complete len:86 (+) Transcript_75185:49-306(+)
MQWPEFRLQKAKQRRRFCLTWSWTSAASELSTQAILRLRKLLATYSRRPNSGHQVSSDVDSYRLPKSVVFQEQDKKLGDICVEYL